MLSLKEQHPHTVPVSRLHVLSHGVSSWDTKLSKMWFSRTDTHALKDGCQFVVLVGDDLNNYDDSFHLLACPSRPPWEKSLGVSAEALITCAHHSEVRLCPVGIAQTSSFQRLENVTTKHNYPLKSLQSVLSYAQGSTSRLSTPGRAQTIRKCNRFIIVHQGCKSTFCLRKPAC